MEEIIQSNFTGLLTKFIQELLNICLNKKECSSIFSLILNPYLDKIIQVFLNAGRLGLIRDIIKVYVNDKEKSTDSSVVLESVSAKLVEELFRRIESNLDWAELAETLILLKDYSAKNLIEKAVFEEKTVGEKYFEAYLKRRIIGKIFNGMPLDSFLMHLKEKLSDPRDYVVKGLLEIIGSIENEGVIEILEPLLKYPNASIRKKLILNLNKTKGQQSAKLLGEALKDEVLNIRKEALRQLKARRDDFALQVLKEYAQRPDLPDDIKQALL